MRRNFLSRGGFRVFLRTSIAVASLLLLPSATFAQDRSGVSAAEIAGPNIQHQLQHVLSHAVTHSKPKPGAALLAASTLKAKDGGDQPVTAFVVGTHSQSDNAPVFPNTPFGIASITKIMVAALTFIYSERGLLELDAPLLDLVDDEGWLLDHASNPVFRV
jgi:CubicO group peptidase (beta-lactamase class C family)